MMVITFLEILEFGIQHPEIRTIDSYSMIQETGNSGPLIRIVLKV